jgi:triosephosphate isomerase
MNVIYCISDNYKNIDDARELIAANLDRIHYLLDENDLIAYEPLWAIGSPDNVDYQYISDVMDVIRENTNLKVLYGGGVDDKNIDNLLALRKLDGFLVSNASLDINKLQVIISKMTNFDKN